MHIQSYICPMMMVRKMTQDDFDEKDIEVLIMIFVTMMMLLMLMLILVMPIMIVKNKVNTFRNSLGFNFYLR